MRFGWYRQKFDVYNWFRWRLKELLAPFFLQREKAAPLLFFG